MAERTSLEEIFSDSVENTSTTSSTNKPSLESIFAGEDNQVAQENGLNTNIGEIKSYKKSLGGDIRNALIGGAFGNVFLRNNPDPESEKRRQLISSLANTASFGIPQAIAKGINAKMAPVQESIQDTIGNTMGLASPLGVANAASKIVKGAGLGSKVIRGAISGGVGGALLPQDTLKQRGETARVGAGFGAGLTFIGSIAPKLINFGGKKTAQAIAQKADKGFDAISEELGKKYENLFNGIKGTTSVDDLTNTISNTLDEYPEAANSGRIKKILTRLNEIKNSGNQVTATDLHNLKQEIRSTIPRSVWSGMSDADAMQTAKMDIYWKINDKLGQMGGEKYTALNQEYRNFKQAEKLARKFFYEQGIPSDKNVNSSMSRLSRDAVRGLSSKLPGKEKFAQDFEAWRRGQIAKKLALGGGGIVLGDFLVRRAIGNFALNRQ